MKLTSWTQRFCLFAILFVVLATDAALDTSPPDIQTLKRLENLDSKAGWRGAGVSLIGCDIVKADGLRHTFGAGELFRFGDQIDLVVYLKISEPLVPPTRVLLSLWGRGQEILLEDLADTLHHGPGAVLRWPVTIPVEPIPSQDEPLPFFQAASSSLNLKVSRISGGLTLLDTEIASLGIAPLLDGLDDDTQCLSANGDISDARKRSAVRRLGFPDGIPDVHSSGTGGLENELFDGVLTGSGNPYWENIFWHVGWGEGERSIELVLDHAMVIDAVSLVIVNPYGNYSVGTITVAAQDQKNNFFDIGAVSVVEDARRPAVRTVLVRTQPAKTRVVKVKLHQDSGEYIALSEAYVFGHARSIGLDREPSSSDAAMVVDPASGPDKENRIHR